MSRDWHKDMEMCEKATPGPWEWHQVDENNSHIRQVETKETIPVSCSDGDLMTEAPEALPYWLRQYAHEANEACYWKGQAEEAKEALARMQCDYQADKQRFHDRARELSEQKERVKELEKALDKPRSHLWFELTNERVKHRSAKESIRLLHTVYEEQSARASEYYNEMVRLSGLKELMETIVSAPVVDPPDVELERIKKACKRLLHDLYLEEGQK